MIVATRKHPMITAVNIADPLALFVFMRFTPCIRFNGILS
jgi:hypothetical protein